MGPKTCQPKFEKGANLGSKRSSFDACIEVAVQVKRKILIGLAGAAFDCKSINIATYSHTVARTLNSASR